MRVGTIDIGAGRRGGRAWGMAGLLGLAFWLSPAAAESAAVYDTSITATISVTGLTATTVTPSTFEDAITDPSPSPCCAASASAQAGTVLPGTLTLAVAGQTSSAGGGGFASSQGLASLAFSLPAPAAALGLASVIVSWSGSVSALADTPIDTSFTFLSLTLALGDETTEFALESLDAPLGGTLPIAGTRTFALELDPGETLDVSLAAAAFGQAFTQRVPLPGTLVLLVVGGLGAAVVGLGRRYLSDANVKARMM